MDGELYIADANIFISHAWRYSFTDVIVDVMEQCEHESPGCYFWFDLFANDQNNVQNRDFDWFCGRFFPCLPVFSSFFFGQKRKKSAGECHIFSLRQYNKDKHSPSLLCWYMLVAGTFRGSIMAIGKV